MSQSGHGRGPGRAVRRRPPVLGGTEIWSVSVTLVGALALFAAGILPLWEVRAKGVQAVQVGAWPAPSGITLAADLFSALMVTLAGLMGAAAQMLDPSGYIEAVLGAGR